MGTLIDDLLSFSRLSRTPLLRQRVDMRALAQEALAELGQIRAEVAIDALPAAWGDAALLRQVWTNLLANAVKYSAGRGADARIQVRGVSDGPRLRYEVIDNGVGFDMRYREKLFGVFQRLHTQDEFEGTGVGLAIVQRIVSRHGGRVDAEGVLGVGATFRFELPVDGT
jgi:light-regulated signal transduction histidine kinase (bacteriophytochrome)